MGEVVKMNTGCLHTKCEEATLGQLILMKANVSAIIEMKKRDLSTPDDVLLDLCFEYDIIDQYIQDVVHAEKERRELVEELDGQTLTIKVRKS